MKRDVTAQDVADWVAWRGWKRPDCSRLVLQQAGASERSYWISGGVVIGTEREVAAGVAKMRATLAGGGR